MINLRKLMDLLPYYFREQDTYKVNGKGILERYLDIFGAYFDDRVLGDINSLDDIIDVDKTPEIYLGYLWEFLGSLPYANPKAIDPEKWKEYFNGFNSASTIETLSRIWVYRKDSDGDHYTLTSDQVRSLVKYSVALFSIRGTKKFFEVLLRLYGFEAVVYNGDTYPRTTIDDDDDSDYYGSDQDYYGTDDDYFGSPESLFNELTEVTKLDTEWVTQDQDTLDNHTNCSKFVNVNFKLNSSYNYSYPSNEFVRLHNRMFNLINNFLPLGARPHLIINDNEPKVTRTIELFVDTTPIGWTSADTHFVASSVYPGWYKVSGTMGQYGPEAYDFDGSSPIRWMVKISDTYPTYFTEEPAFINDQPKRFKLLSNSEPGETEFEDGHIFTIKPGTNFFIGAKLSVIDEDDFILNPSGAGIAWGVIIGWKNKFNYNIFNWYNQSVELELSNTHNYIPIMIQSASVSTYTNDANPDDDTFTPEPVAVDGTDLTLCVSNTTLPDRNGNAVSYGAYAGRCMYVIHLFEVGTYTFYQKSNPDKKLVIKVTRDSEILTASRVEGLANNMVDNDNPTCDIRIAATSNLNFLKKIKTLPMYINDNGGNIWSTICTAAGANSPANKVGNYLNKPYYKIHSTNIYGCNITNRYLPINIALAYLTKPVHKTSQCLKIVITEHNYVNHPTWYDKKTLFFYPVTGSIIAQEEIYTQDTDNEDIYEYKYGSEVLGSGSSPLINQFVISNLSHNKIIDTDGSLVDGVGTSVIYIGLLAGLAAITNNPSVSSNTLYIDYNGLYDDEVLIKETSNPVTKYWNNGELITLDDPGHYRFYGVNEAFDNVSSNKVDINVDSNKYNEKYYLEIYDGNKADDEEYMLRTLIPVPDNVVAGQVCNWSLNFAITLDKSIVEASDILTIDPNAFDFEVLLYKGSTPNQGTLINSFTATNQVLVDEDGNTLPNYKVTGTINLHWKYGNYVLQLPDDNVSTGNFPPGLYCITLHAKNKVWPGQPTYRVADAYIIPQKFDGNLYFDVDVISKAWTSPAGQIFDIDPINGKRTWGWYKTNEDYLYSVRMAQYNPAVDTPTFRLKLTNNSIGYTRVYMYKLVEDGSSWDQDPDSNYPQVLPPILDNTDHTGTPNPHWLNEAIPSDWGFPGAYSNSAHGWIYDPVGYSGRWVFTGTVYQLGELITGPQEPGQYLFMINQLSIDHKSINYAYLSVKEDIDYSLIVDPMLAILQGTAVGTTVSAVSNAKFTKESLYVTVTNNQGVEVAEYHPVPFAFYAYQPGTYTFKLYKFESESYIPILNKDGTQITGTFKVLTDSGVSDEYLTWPWNDTGEKEVQVVTTSADIEWSVKVQTE